MPEGKLLALRNFRIQQLGEAGSSTMLWKSLSDAGLQPVFGIQLDGLGEVVEAILRRAGDRVQHRQPVKGVVGLGMVGQDAFELVGGLLEVAGIQLRNGVVVALLGREEREAAAYPIWRWQVLMYILQRSTISSGAAGSSFSKAASAFSYLPCCTSCTAAW